MPLESYLEPLAEELGNPRFEEVNEQGVCQFTLAERLGSSIWKNVPSDDAVEFYTVVGDAPDHQKEALLQGGCWKRRLYHQEMGEGCCLGWDSTTDEVALSRRLSLRSGALSLEEFKDALNEFVNWAEHWQDHLDDQGPQNSTGVEIYGSNDSFFLRA